MHSLASPSQFVPQSELVSRLLAHAASFSPYYRDQAWAARVRNKADLDSYGDIPITLKSVVRGNASSFLSLQFPEEDGAVTTEFTSGSTGEPLKVAHTQLHFRMNALKIQRLKTGWGLNGHMKYLALAATEADKPQGTVEERNFPNGRCLWTLHGLEATAALTFLRRCGATAVSGFPSLVHDMLKLAHERSVSLPLRLVSTYSEIVTDELREFTRQNFGCRILDRYGAVETSIIAAQCAACGEYHLADRHILFEILRNDGAPAAPGDIGRVLVTPLYNRAMPLLRYDIGDYVELSKNDSCARSYLSIRRIVGREKNIFKLADGRRFAPTIPGDVMPDLGIQKFKLIQTTPQDVELHYMAPAEIPDLTQEVAQRLIDYYLASVLRVTPMRVSDIPRGPGGKYLMHESRVD